MLDQARALGRSPNFGVGAAGPGISSMRSPGRRRSVGAMALLRIAGGAAVAGAVAELVATVLEPDWGGEPGEAARVVADNGFWTGNRLIDLIGGLLAVGALTVAGRAFNEGSGREWARVGQPFLLLTAALGASAVVTGAVLKDLADTWASAAPGAKQSYLAAFDATRTVTENLFFAAFMALGLYLAALAAAILTGRLYARWLGWTSAAAAALILAGNLLLLVAESLWLAVLAGYALFLVVLFALGVSMWRQGSPVLAEADGLKPQAGLVP